MEGLILLLIAGAAIALYSWPNTKEQAWRDVTKQPDLALRKSRPGRRSLHGHLRGFEVQIEEGFDDYQNMRTQVKVGYVTTHFTLNHDDAFKRMRKPDIETGDPLFDERVRVKGDADWALALLGPEARRLTKILVQSWDGTLEQGKLSAWTRNLDEALSVLDLLLDLAQCLRLPSVTDLPKLLVERACHDPLSTVRFQALRQLSGSLVYKKEALAVAETLIDSQRPFLKLEAYRVLMEKNSTQSDRASKEIASLAVRHPESSVRRSALDALLESPQHRALALSAMRNILQGPDTPPVRTAALEGLIRAEAKDELLEVQVHDEAEAEILARGLGNFDVSAQPKLLELLDDSGDRVRAAAVRSLGHVGNLEAIGALRQIAGQDRLFRSALAREAEKAIESIKGRSDGSQLGEVSLVTVAPLDGAVSPADDAEPGGEVSVTS